MSYKWSGMKKLTWEDVKKLHRNGELVGCYKLYPDGTESEISEDYNWKEIESLHNVGVEFGQELKNQNFNILNCEFNVVVSNDDIDDIMAGALEGGINYWCNKAEVVGNYLGEYASEQISRGGQIFLHDMEDSKTYTLDKDKFLRGLKMYLEKTHPYDILEEINNKLIIDTCNADATVCDMIIQYALFDDVIYG